MYLESKISSETENDTYQPTIPSIGPFLESLTKSIDGWLNNSLEVNLALCSVISRLAMYSHPLLRSLILNPYLILQPSVPSLAVSIATLKQRIDSALRVHANPEALIKEARSSLKARFSTTSKKDNLGNSKANKGILQYALRNQPHVSYLFVLFLHFIFAFDLKNLNPKHQNLLGFLGLL